MEKKQHNNSANRRANMQKCKRIKRIEKREAKKDEKKKSY